MCGVFLAALCITVATPVELFVLLLVGIYLGFSFGSQRWREQACAHSSLILAMLAGYRALRTTKPTSTDPIFPNWLLTVPLAFVVTVVVCWVTGAAACIIARRVEQARRVAQAANSSGKPPKLSNHADPPASPIRVTALITLIAVFAVVALGANFRHFQLEQKIAETNQQLKNDEWELRRRRIEAKHHAELEEFYSAFRGHRDSVYAIAFNAEPLALASASGDKSIKLWNLTTLQATQTLLGHTERVLGVAFTPDGRQLISGSADHTIRIWDIDTGETTRRLTGHSGEVSSVVYDAQRKRIISSSHDKTIKIWSAETGDNLFTIEGHRDLVREVAISPDGKLLASASLDHTVRIWDAEEATARLTLTAHQAPVTCVAFSPDSQRVVSGAFESSVKVWDVTTGDELLGWNPSSYGNRRLVLSVAFGPGGEFVANASAHAKESALGCVELRDATSGKLVKAFWPHGQNDVRSVRFHPNGTHLASGADDGTVRLWSTQLEEAHLNLPEEPNH